MEDLVRRATYARIEMHPVCKKAGVSATVFYRWKHEDKPPTLPTIGKLEAALTELEGVQ